jgi:ribosomal protein S18 acetylase RimI-like enzyme
MMIRVADLALAADRQAVLDLLDMYSRHEFGASQPLREDVRERLLPGLQQHPGHVSFLAWEGEKAVGLAICFQGFSSFKARPLLNIHDLAVAPTHRGQGVGQALLAAIEAEAARRGCCRITLEVREDNVGAQHSHWYQAGR